MANDAMGRIGTLRSLADDAGFLAEELGGLESCDSVELHDRLTEALGSLSELRLKVEQLLANKS
jgi:hypothetical protein